MNARSYIWLIALLVPALVDSEVIGQTKHLYVVELDSAVTELRNYKESSGFYDINQIKSLSKTETDLKSSRFGDLKYLVEETQATSIRKLIRRLPDDIKTLRTRRGLDMSVEHYQRLFVLEVSTILGDKEKADLKTKYRSVKSIEKDPVVAVDAWPPNDSYWSYQTQFYGTTYNINLPRAWDFTAGNSGIKVAIVDHGIDYNHTDLGGGFGTGNRVRGGWDWKDNDPYPLPTYSTETHATPIAGMIGAINWNNTGVVGIAGGSSSAVESGCQLFSFRCTSEDLAPNGLNGIQTALVSEAVFEAATDPSVNNGYGYGVHVINCSFGGPDPNYWEWSLTPYHSYYGSFAWAYINSVVVTVSRGNEGNDGRQYPANFSNGDVVFSVSGVDNAGTIHPSSSYGDGVTISSPWYLSYTTGNGGTYQSFSGTSNAAPMVAGVSALVLSEFRERGVTVLAEDVREILSIGAQPTTDPYRYGAGRVDAGRALYLSSQSFGLQHVAATKNRSVTTVANPSGDVIGLYYPYGMYIVQQTKRIRGSVDVPTYFLEDSSWVWGNANSEGLKWGNPSYGMLGASFVSRNGREHTFEMFAYELRDLAGNYLGWYPFNPSTANIQVSILGRYMPFSATMSGPTTVFHPAKGTVNQYTWTANPSGGIPPYTFSWYRNGLPLSVSTQSYTEYYSFNGWNCDSYQFTLSVDVRDASNPPSLLSPNKVVTAWNSCGGESIAAPGAEPTLMLPDEFSVDQNFPNPFNPETDISFALPEPSSVKVTVSDMLGREIVTLVDRDYPAGYQRVTWKGTDGSGNKVGSGVYFYRIIAAGQSGKKFTKVMKMALTK